MENLSFVAHMTMEKHIIERLKLGDEKAFKYIYDCHYVLLCRFAYQLLDDSSLSEEVVDDAERVHVKDMFGFQRVREGRYNAAIVDSFPWSMEMFEDFLEWFKTDEKAKPYQHLDWTKDLEETKAGVSRTHLRYIQGSVMKSVKDV